MSKPMQYSKALDVLLASVVAYREGRIEQAAKLFETAAGSKSIYRALDVVASMNEKAFAAQAGSASTPPSFAAVLAAARDAQAKALASPEDGTGADELDLDSLSVEETDDGLELDLGPGSEESADESQDGPAESDEVDIDAVIDSLDAMDKGEEAEADDCIDPAVDAFGEEAQTRLTARLARAQSNLASLP